MLHALFHLAVPALGAYLFYRNRWLYAWLWMLAGILIDIDHMWATPIFNPDRCSLGFHTFHQYWLIPIYFLLILPERTRLLGIGLGIHIVLDAWECWRISGFPFFGQSITNWFFS